MTIYAAEQNTSGRLINLYTKTTQISHDANVHKKANQLHKTNNYLI